MNKLVLNGEEFYLCGEFEEIYSTQETRIGTWIDGKPVYRIVIKFLSGSGGSVNVSYLNIDSIVRIDGIGFYSRNNVSYNYLLNTFNPVQGTIYGLTIDKDGKLTYIPYDMSPPALSGFECHCILEYTKTTDAASIIIGSEVIPKLSGTVMHEGERYDYELGRDINFAASSSAHAFNGFGSSAYASSIGSISNNIL